MSKYILKSSSIFLKVTETIFCWISFRKTPNPTSKGHPSLLSSFKIPFILLVITFGTTEKIVREKVQENRNIYVKIINEQHLKNSDLPTNIFLRLAQRVPNMVSQCCWIRTTQPGDKANDGTVVYRRKCHPVPRLQAGKTASRILLYHWGNSSDNSRHSSRVTQLTRGRECSFWFHCKDTSQFQKLKQSSHREKHEGSHTTVTRGMQQPPWTQWDGKETTSAAPSVAGSNSFDFQSTPSSKSSVICSQHMGYFQIPTVLLHASARAAQENQHSRTRQTWFSWLPRADVRDPKWQQGDFLQGISRLVSSPGLASACTAWCLFRKTSVMGDGPSLLQPRSHLMRLLKAPTQTQSQVFRVGFSSNELGGWGRDKSSP